MGRLTALFFGLFLFASCSDIFMDSQKANTPQNNYDLLWQIIDERYCFFEEKNVDWDSAYAACSPSDLQKFTKGDPSSSYLFGELSAMLSALRDGHVCLSDGGLQTSAYTGWSDKYPKNLRDDLLYQYVNRRTRYLSNNISISVLSDPVGYIRCPSFTEKINRKDLDKAMAAFVDCKGVIIDVRSNGGGLVSEAYALASRFVREKTHVGYVRYKTGKGRNDFSDYFGRYVEPEGANPFYGKVAVITNRSVYSAANLFVSVMKNLPRVCIMGDRTGGGGGVPISAELYNGWTVELSTNPIFDINKRSIESGIEPHHIVMLDTKDNAQTDNIIESAKKWILE